MKNISFDGSPVQFRMDSSLVVCFDPLALDMIRDVLSREVLLDAGRLAERVNATCPAMSCHTIDDFRPGMYTLDPRDIQSFGDEEQDYDYCDGERTQSEAADEAASFPFATVDSGTLIVVDFAHLPDLLTLLTWEQYDLGLQDDTAFAKITDALGGPCFAVICMPDGDGMYLIPPGCVKPSRD